MTKLTESSWKMLDAARKRAAAEGDEIAKTHQFVDPPIDPFAIIRAEQNLIHAEGYDFQDAFDGRIKFVGPRFLISFNTRYNDWPHVGQYHSKIVFTVAHELGHFFLPAHREYLVTSKKPHGSFTEFTADPIVEQQADCFASALLMPRHLFSPRFNETNFPSLEAVKSVRKEYQVSLTGMLVRWTQLSDFPCATVAMSEGQIRFGWISSALSKAGAWKLRRGELAKTRDLQRFIQADPAVLTYRDGAGQGAILNWIDFDRMRMLTQEFYFAIPHTKTIWALVFADENELPQSRWES